MGFKAFVEFMIGFLSVILRRIAIWSEISSVLSKFGGDEGDDEWEGDYGTFHTNEFSEVVRTVAGATAEAVELTDCFQHPKTGRVSHCWRVTYRSLEGTLTTD